MTTSFLAAVDLGYAPHVVLALYMLMLLFLGYMGYRRNKGSEEDYYLAGRGQGVIVTTLTIMATMFSSAAVLGIPGLIYKDGVGFLVFALNLPLSGAAVYVLGSRIRRLGQKHGFVTPGDLLAHHYGDSASVRVLAALAGFLYVIPYIVMQMRAGGHLAERMFPNAKSVNLLGMELDMFGMGSTVLSLITMLYVLVGGMRSVAWTDVVQGFLLLSGMLIAGIATVSAMGGITGFFTELQKLPPEAHALPGPSNAWSPWKMMTICMFASLATMIGPGQWIRYYSAKSDAILRRTSVIFAIVLPICFLFGVMLVALGGRVIFPPEVTAEGLVPHPEVGRFDQIVIVMIQEHIPALIGAAGTIVVSVIFVAVMAASMSTADSNLHALSAVLTRDVYDRFVRPKASERERTWVGRAIIVVATLIALALVHHGERSPEFAPMKLIAEMMMVAIGFSCQLLPATIDVLFLKKGTKWGMVAGTAAGLLFVAGFLVFDPGSAPAEFFAGLKRTFDIGFCGFVVNAAVFAVVSLVTRRPNN